MYLCDNLVLMLFMLRLHQCGLVWSRLADLSSDLISPVGGGGGGCGSTIYTITHFV